MSKLALVVILSIGLLSGGLIGYFYGSDAGETEGFVNTMDYSRCSFLSLFPFSNDLNIDLVFDTCAELHLSEKSQELAIIYRVN